MRILPGQFQVNGSRFGPELNRYLLRPQRYFLAGAGTASPDTEPDAIPFTAEGRRAFDAYDPALRPWNCVDLGVKDMPPDLDELTRMLEEL